MSAELSGRMDNLEAAYTFIMQELLVKPSNNNFDDYIQTWNSQFADIAANIDRLKQQVAVLQNLAMNLNITVTTNRNLFNQHTGSYAITGHAGLEP